MYMCMCTCIYRALINFVFIHLACPLLINSAWKLNSGHTISRKVN